MRRQTMQPFFILLIMAVALILNFSSSAATNDFEGRVEDSSNAPHEGKGSPRNKSLPAPHPRPPSRSSPSRPPLPSPPSRPPSPSSKPTSPSPMPPPSSSPLPPRSLSPRPPPSSSPPPKNLVGKAVGFLFLGIAGVLQVGVVSFLVFKRWQIRRVQDETGVRLVS